MISRLTNRITESHKNVTLLINCLDHAMASYQKYFTHNKNISIIHEAMSYLHLHHHHFYHPLKIHLIAKLKLRLTSNKSRLNLDKIELKDKHLYDLNFLLFDLLNKVKSGQVISINLLYSSYHEYRQLLKIQMMLESRHFIPVVKSYISNKEMLLVENKIKENPDPLFGPHVWSIYKNLYHHIMKYSVVDSVA